MRRALLALVLGFGAGCAAIIDLGEKPALSPDAGGAAAAAAACGLEPSTDPTCASCIQSSCCAQSKACAADPDCVEGLECIKTCLGQIDCIAACLNTHDLHDLTTCSATQCPECTPGPHCQKLGACCTPLAKTGAEALLRVSCQGTVLDLDEQACDVEREQVGRIYDGGADGSPNPCL